MQPQDGDNCMGMGGLQCPFANGVTCSCFQGSWHCPEPCPVDAPNPGDACNLAPMQQCNYANTTCVCLQGQFFCN